MPLVREAVRWSSRERSKADDCIRIAFLESAGITCCRADLARTLPERHPGVNVALTIGVTSGAISMKMVFNLGAAAIGLLFGVLPVIAASVVSDRHWSTNHLAQLPAELQRRVLVLQRTCGSEISAQHYFSTSIEIGKKGFRALHFQDLSCRNRQSICTKGGCLHEIYRRRNGTFGKIFGLFAQDVRMESYSGTLLIRATLGSETQSFRWTGRTFVRAH